MTDSRAAPPSEVLEQLAETGSMDEDGWEKKHSMMSAMYFNTLDGLRRPGPIPSWSESPLTIMRVLVEAIEHSQDSDDG